MIWEKYGYTMTKWQSLDWKIKRTLLYNAGQGNFWAYYFPALYRQIKTLITWYNQPVGGYLLDAWFKFNAETFTLKQYRR